MPPDEDMAVERAVGGAGSKVSISSASRLSCRGGEDDGAAGATVSSGLKSIVKLDEVGGEKCNSASGYVLLFLGSVQSR